MRGRTEPAATFANPPRAWGIALLLILAIFAFRVHSIHTTYMREDEELAFRWTTDRDLAFTISYQAEHDVQAPLWFVTFWAWQKAAGSTEFAARVYSILLSSLTLAVVYQIGRRWFGAWQYGVFAAAVLGANAYAHVYSLEIRPYALILLFASVNMLLFERWLARQTRRDTVLYGVSVAALLWTHYFAAFLVLAQVVYMVLFRLRTRRLLGQGMTAALAALLVWLPWLPVFLSQVQELRSVEISSGVYRGLGVGSVAEPTSLPTILSLVQVATNGLPFVFLAVVLAGAIKLWRRTGFHLALVWVFGAAALNLTLNLIAGVYTQRYVSFISVGVAVLIGASLASFPARLRWLALAAFVALNLAALPAALPTHIPHRAIFQSVSANAQPGDAVYFTNTLRTDHLVRWGVQHYLLPDLQANVVDTLDAAREARTVWFITPHFFDDEVQTAFRSIERDHPLQTVVGNCSPAWCYLAQRLQAPPLDAPILFGDAMPFWGADVDGVTPAGVDARLWWRAETPPPADYSISVQVLDSSGALVVQSDGPIREDEQVITQTSQMQPDRIYIHRPVLNPSQPLAPGTYRLVLIVYQSWDNIRLTLPDGSDTLLLETFSIP